MEIHLLTKLGRPYHPKVLQTIRSADTTHFIVLYFIALGKYYVFINIETRASTSNKIMTH